MKRLEMKDVFDGYLFVRAGGGRYLARNGWYPLLGLPGAIDTHRGAILFCQLQKPVEAEVKKFCLNGVIEKIRIHRSARVHTLDTMLLLASDLFHEFEVCQIPMMSDTEVEGFVGAIVDRHRKPSTTTTTIQPTPVGSEVNPPDDIPEVDNEKLSALIARTQTSPNPQDQQEQEAMFEPDPQAPAPTAGSVALQYFDVSDDGTIYDSRLDPFSKPRSEVYGFDADGDIVFEAEHCPPLASHLQTLASYARDELAELIDSKSLNLVERRKAQLRYDLLEDEDDGWKAWFKTLSNDEREPIRESIDAWLSESPSALQEDDYIPDWLDSQRGPMSVFQDLDSDIIDALKIRIIQGEHPGSTYYAAELHSPIEAANRICEERRLCFRFNAEGKPGD